MDNIDNCLGNPDVHGQVAIEPLYNPTSVNMSLPDNDNSSFNAMENILDPVSYPSESIHSSPIANPQHCNIDRSLNDIMNEELDIIMTVNKENETPSPNPE